MSGIRSAVFAVLVALGVGSGSAWALTPMADSELADKANADVLRLLQHEATDEDMMAIPGLLDAFPNAGHVVQHSILRIFTQLFDEAGEHRAAMMDTAAEALSSDEPAVRGVALDLLGRAGDETIVPLVIPLIDDPDWAVQYQALYVIAPFAEAGNHPEIFVALAPLVESDNERLRVAARSLMAFAPSQ